MLLVMSVALGLLVVFLGVCGARLGRAERALEALQGKYAELAKAYRDNCESAVCTDNELGNLRAHGAKLQRDLEAACAAREDARTESRALRFELNAARAELDQRQLALSEAQMELTKAQAERQQYLDLVIAKNRALIAHIDAVRDIAYGAETVLPASGG